MPRHLAAVAVLSLAAFLLGQAANRPAWACAAVSSEGAQVTIATETALIVWDEKAKKQHFIRRASFTTKVPYFGFLVPTPTQPELAEAPDELFTRLEDWTKAEIKTEKRYQPLPYLPSFMMSADLNGGGVQVLDRQRVAGYDAVVLKAGDAEELRQWLEKHGYDARPALSAWLAPYVKAGWVLTAFQVAKSDRGSDYLSTQGVRMSFTAERPFFPYREPPDPRDNPYVGPGRVLRVFLVAGQRMQGAFDDPKTKWAGKAVWAGPLKDRHQELQKHLDAKTVALPEDAWLTVFDDHTLSRPENSDVFFSSSADQSELRRPPVTRYEVVYFPDHSQIYFLVLVVGLVVSIFLLWWVQSRARRRPA